MKSISFNNEENKIIKILAAGLNIDSRKISVDEVFCACAASVPQHITNKKVSDKQAEVSTYSHGIDYAQQAINQGARAILWEPTPQLQQVKKYFRAIDNKLDNKKLEVPLYRVDNLHKKLGFLAAQFYQQPSLQMQIMGITGTNGKTSISYFIAQVLSAQGQPCGVIGTLGNGLYGKTLPSTHTTPDAIQLQKILAAMQAEQAKAVVMEVSSHALHQYRVADVNFDIAIFTNLSRDHLDYHGSMKNYANEKMKLFQFDSLSTAVINLDDVFAKQLISNINSEQVKIIGYSCVEDKQLVLGNSPLDEIIRAKNIHSYATGSEFTLCMGKQLATVNLPLIGQFNISNALATAATLYSMGFEFDLIANLLGQLKSVPGRMELVKAIDATKVKKANKEIQLVIDYAHTPDALEQALKALQQHKKNNLWCIFGCGGNRDKGKRAEMAKI
ncbi:MAG: UDP-N-acetylmuramoyl-L-alanyl-D-glutamate--2,6-diaminopimelate ligase, partial [Pseudomonadota bacterium]